jgi:hypothetical protein
VTKTSLGPSRISYSHSESTPIHGTGQGSCSSPSIWLHSSCFLMDILEEHSYGFRASSVNKSLSVKVNNQGFVDDTSIMVNGGQDTTELLSRLRHDSQTWSNLLSSSGGVLQLSKCLYYIVDFVFDQTGNPKMMVPEHSPLLISTTPSSTPQPIRMLSPHESHKTLGCYRALNGNESLQYTILLNKSKDWAIQLKSKFLTRQEAWMCYHNYFVPQIMYSLMTTNFTQVQCQTIQSPVINALLPLIGFNRHTSRSIIFAPAQFGGVGMLDLYKELYTRKIEQIVMLTRNSNNEIGQLIKINLSLLQLIVGTSTPYLELEEKITYIQQTWFSGLHEFLTYQQAKIKIKDIWHPRPVRMRDKVLMDDFLGVSADRVQVINNWRLYFQVNTISDMTDPDGKYICQKYLKYPTDSDIQFNPSRRSLLNWPTQGKPSQRSFC